MKFSLDAAEWNKTMNALEKMRQNSLDTILIRAELGKVYLEYSHDTASVSAPLLPLGFGEGGRAEVSLLKLRQTTEWMKAGEVFFETDGSRLRLRAEGAKYHLPMLGNLHYMPVGKPEERGAVFDPQELATGFRRALLGAEKMSKGYHAASMAIHLRWQHGKEGVRLFIYGVDGRKGVISQVPAKVVEEVSTGMYLATVLLSQTACQTFIARLAGETEPVRFRMNQRAAELAVGESEWRALAYATEPKATLEAMEKVLGRMRPAAVFASEDFKGALDKAGRVYLGEWLSADLFIGENRVTVRADDDMGGASEFSFEADTETTIEGRYNGEWMKEAARVIEGSIALNIDPNSKAACFTPSDGERKCRYFIAAQRLRTELEGAK